MNRNLLLLLAFAFASCTKEHGEPADTQPPVIKLTSPTDNQTYLSSQPVPVSGTLTDNVKLSEMHIEIVNTTSGAFITHEHYQAGGTSYSFNKSYTLPGGASYRFKVEAVDDKGNDAEATVTVRVN